MTDVPSPPSWDLEGIRELVVQNDLERGRIEYKRELGNGHSVLQAIAAMANTFGGTVLVGVDEDREGSARLAGVPGGDRDRLARMCWDQLVPPFSPDIIPVGLGEDRYVLAVVVDHLHARRPVMLAHGSKVLVRIEGHNVAADWYRLRDLYAEHSVLDVGLPAADQDMPADQADVHDIDVVLRGRLLLTGPPGLPRRITESGRAAVLAALAGDQSLTGSGTLGRFLQQPSPRGQGQRNSWALQGHASTQEINARWIGPRHDNRTLARASLHVKLTPVPAHGDSLLARLDIQLTNPGRPRPATQDRVKLGALSFADADDMLPKQLPSYDPFISFGFLRDLMLGILGTLWGPAGDTLATSVLGHALGPPAHIDLTIFATRFSDNPVTPGLDRCIDFGTARRISDSYPATWTQLGPLRPDRALLSATEQQRVVREWLIQLGIDNGYDNVEQEVDATQSPCNNPQQPSAARHGEPI